MPRIKRWFPVSHDINRDPEMWDLCAQFGDKALRCWLEILSIADRNEGDVPGSLDSISTAVSWAIRCRSTKTRQILDSMLTKGWLNVDGGLKVTNYLKYHRTREPNKIPSEPSEPSEPILIKNAAPLADLAKASNTGNGKRSLDARIKKWSDLIFAADQKKFARILVWIKAAERTYAVEVIAATLERFLPHATEVVDWWPYLDKILDKQEAVQNGRNAENQSEQFKRAEREWLKG